MDVVGGGSARAIYYDRNPSTIFQSGGATPGASQQATSDSWTYTVPSGKRLFLENTSAEVYNDAAIALNAQARAAIRVTTGGNGPNDLSRARILTGEASVWRQDSKSMQALFVAGDVIRGTVVSDNNAAGTNVVLNVSAKGVEYDA